MENNLRRRKRDEGEILCSYGDSLSETVRKLCHDVNRIKVRGWQVIDGVNISYRNGFVAEQKVAKHSENLQYEYDIVWVYATTISRAKIELQEAVKQREAKGWKVEGEASEIKREGVYSKCSEMWYLAQVMLKL